MGIESAADRLVYLDPDVFGTEVTYTAVGGGAPAAITGIFDAAAEAIELNMGVAIASVAPQVVVRTSDLANGGRQGDTFVIEGNTYKAADVSPDGTGFTTVRLERQ